jgi:hydrogenase expression/formation protein HypD
MKHLSEYRDLQLVRDLVSRIKSIVTQPWTIMEVCGGQTHSLVKNGILDMLPAEIEMVHGPGCPVCVTPIGIIDEAVMLSRRPGVILCSFGDMLRVPGTTDSLLEAKAQGADIRIVYSPLEAVKLAAGNPLREVIFLGVGFETTAPANALSVVQADQLGISNYSVLASHVLVPPAMEAILSDPETRVDAFLAAGHVCTIMGIAEYVPIAEKFKVPIVVTGFEPVDLLQGICSAVQQLERGEHTVENQYARVVLAEGNPMARQTISTVFDISDRDWRGIGRIPGSGWEINNRFRKYNARIKFDLGELVEKENKSCVAGDIMKGKLKPHQCPNFGILCTPEHPLGAPMVSSEGSCAAYYHFAKFQEHEHV